MLETAKALYDFWNSFGIPAYVENNIPEEAELPYITYRLVKPDAMYQSAYYARIWYHDTSFTGILTKAQEIEETIAGGYSIPLSYGNIVLYKEDEFIQLEDSEEDELKIVYLNMIIEVHK